jgi:hypothetical protein
VPSLAKLIQVNVRQQPTAIGGASASPICDDQHHTTTLNVLPGPFQQGRALAEAVLFDGSTFNSVNANAEVNIK